MTFVQISDSHIGFNKPANPDVTGTLQVAIDRINALDAQPDLILHTGDLTHSAKPAEFDMLAQSLQSSKQKQTFYVPGEHDILEGMGKLGDEQLTWLQNDLKKLSKSTPIVVFAHIPLWAVYPEWGWDTSDSAQALTYLKPFGSVTILNGHIHQVMQKAR
jgi:3',5'-cyclic-AMP phosphodiesterase